MKKSTQVFANELAEQLSITKKEAKAFTDAFIANITSTLVAGDSINFIGNFSMSVKERAARVGRNPSTGKPIDIPASKSVAFKLGKALKTAINA